jgi:hypothetical protein
MGWVGVGFAMHDDDGDVSSHASELPREESMQVCRGQKEVCKEGQHQDKVHAMITQCTYNTDIHTHTHTHARVRAHSP